MANKKYENGFGKFEKLRGSIVHLNEVPPARSSPRSFAVKRGGSPTTNYHKWIFQRYAKPGDKILDTHLGSGSSRIAAYDADLDFTGYEIDAEYFAKQEKRFAAHTAQMSLFVDGATYPFWGDGGAYEKDRKSQ